MAFVFIFRENWKKNLSICNETPKICDLLVLFCLNVLCNYYVIFFWRDRISPNPCAIFILFWWVKNECLWHSVKTPNRDMDNKWVAEKSFLKLLSTKLLSIKLIYFTQKIFVLPSYFFSLERTLIEFVISVIDPTHILAGIIIFSFQNFQITFKKEKSTSMTWREHTF